MGLRRKRVSVTEDGVRVVLNGPSCNKMQGRDNLRCVKACLS